MEACELEDLLIESREFNRKRFVFENARALQQGNVQFYNRIAVARFENAVVNAYAEFVAIIDDVGFFELFGFHC